MYYNSAKFHNGKARQCSTIKLVDTTYKSVDILFLNYNFYLVPDIREEHTAINISLIVFIFFFKNIILFFSVFLS